MKLKLLRVQTLFPQATVLGSFSLVFLVIFFTPKVTVRGAPLTKAKRSRRTLKKTELQNRHQAARPFDLLVRPSKNNWGQNNWGQSKLNAVIIL